MKNILILFSLVLLLSSCDEWLDIKPKGKIIPDKTQDYRMLLDQVKEKGKSTGFKNGYFNVTLSSDDVEIYDDALNMYYAEMDKKIYTWQESIVLNDEEDYDWKNLYSQIYVANLVASQVMDSDGPIDVRKQLLAEAKIQRAFSYFVLVNTYGKHYNSNTSDTDLGVPLLLKGDLNANLKRASVKKVYDQIIIDINQSIEDLPEVAEYNHRPSKCAAFALLARVYLFMADYKAALENSEEALKLNNALYDYNKLPENPYYGGVIGLPEMFENKEIVFCKPASDMYTPLLISKDLKDLYGDNDIRFTGRFSVEWFEPYTHYMYNYVLAMYKSYGLNVSEILLMRAECNARLGAFSKAMDDVNTIREKRVTTGHYVAQTADNTEEALKIVKDERRRELAFRGMRWFDLKRYNAHDNANISLTRFSNGVNYTLNANDNRWAFPIGMKYILKNPEIEQNPY